MKIKKLLLFLFILIPFLVQAHILNFGTDGNDILQGPPPANPITITKFSQDVSGDLISDKTLFFVDFTNPNANGDEIGLSGNSFDTQANLEWTQVGNIPGAVNTSPFAGDDDLWHRTLDGSTQYWQSIRNYISGDIKNWELRIYYFNLSNGAGQQNIYDNGNAVGTTNRGFSIFKNTTGNVRVEVSNGAAPVLYLETTVALMSPTTWYQISFYRFGDDYQVVFSPNKFNTQAEFDLIPADNKTTLSFDGAAGNVDWGTSTNLPEIGRRSTGINHTDGSYQMLTAILENRFHD